MEYTDLEYASHHGREIAYRFSDRGGDGPTTLLVHGSGGFHAVWRSQFRLGDVAPIAALDLSGHGESDDVDAEPGYETLSAYVSDVLAVADAVDAEVFVGHSMGGAVLLQAVLDREVDPSGLVLSNTGAKLAVLEDLLAWLADDFDRAIEFLHEPERLFYEPTDDLVEQSAAAMRSTGRQVTERDFLTSHEFDVRDRVDEIDIPALAIVGEYDRLTPPEYHEYFVEEMPDCRMETIDDTAHMPMLERPAAYNRRLEEFLDSIEERETS